MTSRQRVPSLSGRATATGQAAGSASGVSGPARNRDAALSPDTHELENRLRRGEALARMGHFTIEVDGDRVDWSEGHNQIWGYARDAAPSLADVVSRIHADDRRRVREAFERSQRGVPVTVEFRLVRLDGTELTLRTLVETFEHPAIGRAVYSGTTADVTAQKQVEAAVVSGDQRLSQAVRLGRLGIFDHDHASGQVYWSPEQCAIWGFEPKPNPTVELTLERVHPDDRARVEFAMLRSHDPRGDGAFDIEHRVITKGGAVRWIHARAQTSFDGEGAARHPVRTVGATADITELKHVEIDLRIKDLALSSWASGVLIVGLDNLIAYCNPAWLRMHGYDDGREVLGKAPFSFVADTGQHTRVRESLYTVGSWKGEIASIRRDGSTFDAELAITSVMGADGSRVAFFGSIQDVTERKRAEAQVRRSEAILRSVFEASKDAIVVTKRQRILFANRATVEMYGFDDAAQLEGLPLSTRVPASELPRVLAINKAREEGQPSPSSYETKGLRRDGSEFDAEVSASTYTIDDEVFPLVVIRDISARKAADRALRESAERLSKVFNSTSDAQLLYRVTERGELLIVSANQAYRSVRQRAFPGAEPQPLEGQLRHDMLAGQGLTPAQIEMEMPAFRQVMETRQPVSHELEIPLPDGQVSVVEARIEPVLDSDGHVTHLLWVGRDISERRRAEEALRELNVELERRVADRTAQLEAANSELEAFAYSVSHDLRAPARAVDSFAGILTEDYGPRLDAEGLRLCGVVRSEAQRMGRLIDDLLTFSRLGRSSMQAGSVDMAALVAEVFEELTLNQDRGRITLRVGDLPRAFGDRALLRQVWVNLMANALKFSAKRPISVIDVGGRTGAAETVYTVADNGAGFDMAYRAKLFGVFQRLHSEHEFDGTGVGLAIVQRIVHRHGGTVWAEGEVGRGASFSFVLPIPELAS